jgi:hypothetical protein
VSALDNAKAALARREAQNRTDPFHFGLTDHMYVALAALIAEHERVLAERAAPQEWEYGSALRSASGVIWDATPEASLEEAEEAVQLAETSPDDYAPDECIVVRRTRERPASPWEPLPEDTNQTDDRSER